MLDNLLNLVREHAGDAIIRNKAIPDERNEEAIQTTAGGILDHLKSLAKNGGKEKIMSLFQGADPGSNEETRLMSNRIAGTLMNKFGISAADAGSVVQNLIPSVMQQFVSKTNDPNDNSFHLQDILKTVLTAKAGGIMGILGVVMNLFKK